jgi:hypothetical protein
MLRIHCMQQWFTLSDPAMEEALHDIALCPTDKIASKVVVGAKVLRFGKSTGYAEATVTFAASGEVVARASAEFAF